MPARYEAMRDKFAKSMDYDAAQKKAARIYNATRKPGEPKLSNKHHRQKLIHKALS